MIPKPDIFVAKNVGEDETLLFTHSAEIVAT